MVSQTLCHFKLIQPRQARHHDSDVNMISIIKKASNHKWNMMLLTRGLATDTVFEEQREGFYFLGSC